VGGDGGCGVLQHRRGKGVRKLQEIAGLVARGGAHRGVADGGGARPESTRESGLPVAGGSGPGAGSGGEARALERSRRGVETGERVGAVVGAAERERKERGGSGRGSAMRRGTASWGLAPTGGRRPDCVPAGRDPDVTRAGGASLFGQRCAGSDRAGPGGSESGEARVARGRAWAGPRRKWGGRAQMNSKVLHLFELV
jgi:hypothetical protein